MPKKYIFLVQKNVLFGMAHDGCSRTSHFYAIYFEVWCVYWLSSFLNLKAILHKKRNGSRRPPKIVIIVLLKGSKLQRHGSHFYVVFILFCLIFFLNPQGGEWELQLWSLHRHVTIHCHIHRSIIYCIVCSVDTSDCLCLSCSSRRKKNLILMT